MIIRAQGSLWLRLRNGDVRHLESNCDLSPASDLPLAGGEVRHKLKRVKVFILRNNVKFCVKFSLVIVGLNLCATHGLVPSHAFLTRNDNCLDYINFWSHKNSATYVLDASLTDHCPVCICCENTEKTLSTEMTANSVTYVDEAAVD